jgi:hypothetical protein
MNKNWIKEAIKNKGGLHKSLGIKEEKTISETKLDKAFNSKNTKVRKEANLAKTLRSFRPRGK